ncbi:MAG: LPS-assembly protein LptD [Nitrospirae bacterium]|nr:LPS-assembly protein LptD [Nitrospirota bacterium]
MKRYITWKNRRSSYILNLIYPRLHSIFSPVTIIIFLLVFHLLLFFTVVSAQESIDISANHLEYTSETGIYSAKGSARIVLGDTTLSADEINVNKITSDAVAIGSVVYEDSETIINAEMVELNFRTKLGTIYNSRIYYKKDNFHIIGGDIKKIGENNFNMETATVTTCNAEHPAWHITAKNINTIQHKSIEAKNMTFYVKDTPLFYVPYFRIPLVDKRRSGLLAPVLGISSKKGFTYKQGFFWAIKQNMDATLYLDYYSKKGLGKGLEYRYIINPENNGKIWIYHLKDNDLNRDFYEIKAYSNMSLPNDISGYLKLNAVNKFDYYDELGSTSVRGNMLPSLKSIIVGSESEEKLQKNLESNLYLSKAFYGGWAYFLSQYLQSLEGSSNTTPQRLPEIGLIINTKSIGHFSFDMAAKGTNFWRKEGQTGQRLDINPNLYFSYGKLINLTQKAGLRETSYFLSEPDENKDRLFIDLRTILTTKLFKRYPSFIHLIEPSLEYTYIPPAGDEDFPSFDATDTISETKSLKYVFTNRFEGLNTAGLDARLRLSQSYSFLNKENPFSPVLAEGSLASNMMNFNINASYDVYESRVTDSIVSARLNNKTGFIGIGKNFRRSAQLDQVSIDGGTNRPITINGKLFPIFLYGNMWYDLKGAGVQESNLKTTYKSQCWSLMASFTKKPDEYQFTLGVEFMGLGTIKW